jgi:hypothetical protein
MVESVVMTHIATAGISVAAINWLKNSPYFPWITQEKSKVMRAIALLTAAVGTIGIEYTWNPAGRVLSFTIPTFMAMLTGLGVYIKSFVLQELAYQATRKPNLADLAKAVIGAMHNESTALGPAPAGIAPAPGVPGVKP